MIGIGVIGLGFMGRTHIRAYAAAAEAGHACRIVAVCDLARARMAEAPRGNLGPLVEAGSAELAAAANYAEVDALLADPGVALVSICTYTETHAELAVRALAAGMHVLVEKPVALAAGDVRRVARAAAGAGKLCMPGMCMRFWPAWAWLRGRVRDGRFGAVRSAVFQRLAGPPRWAEEFYRDPLRSGGALADLHIHDADFLYWCFGRPRAVVSAGSLDHVTTLYRYAEGEPGHCVAEGGWDHEPGFGFRMRFVVIFEGATADFDIGRDPQLVLYSDGRAEAVCVEPISGYDAEVRHLLDAIRDGRSELDATLEDAAAVAEVLDAERRSLEAGGAPIDLPS